MPTVAAPETDRVVEVEGPPGTRCPLRSSPLPPSRLEDIAALFLFFLSVSLFPLQLGVHGKVEGSTCPGNPSCVRVMPRAPGLRTATMLSGGDEGTAALGTGA